MNLDDQLNAIILEMRGLENERDNIDAERRVLREQYARSDKELVDRAYEINGELRKLSILQNSVTRQKLEGAE